MAPPLPAASRPSITISRPGRCSPVPICPPRWRRSWRKRCWASARRRSYSLRLIRASRSSSSRRPMPRNLPGGGEAGPDARQLVGDRRRAAALALLAGTRGGRTAHGEHPADDRADAEDEPLDRVAEVRSVVEHGRGDVRRVLAFRRLRTAAAAGTSARRRRRAAAPAWGSRCGAPRSAWCPTGPRAGRARASRSGAAVR